jgi:hypothetical protein
VIEENVFKKDHEGEQAANDSNMLLIVGKKSKKTGQEKEQGSRKSEKKKLSNKERKRLEKVIERKTKSSKRSDLLEKLASVQIKTDELRLYKSVKDIGQKEKRNRNGDDFAAGLIQTNDVDVDLSVENQRSASSLVKSDKIKQVVVNSISGSNKKRKKGAGSESEKSEVSSIDTDDMSTDSEGEINAALEKHRQQLLKSAEQREKELQKKYAEYKTDKIESDDEVDGKTNGADFKSKRKTKYVHVNRRDEIKVSCLFSFKIFEIFSN